MEKKHLKKSDKILYHYDNFGRKFIGPHKRLKGDTSNIYGECSRLYGHCEEGLVGDCDLIGGDCTDIVGNLSEIRDRPANIENCIEE